MGADMRGGGKLVHVVVDRVAGEAMPEGGEGVVEAPGSWTSTPRGRHRGDAAPGSSSGHRRTNELELPPLLGHRLDTADWSSHRRRRRRRR